MYKKVLACILIFIMCSIAYGDQLSDELIMLNNSNIPQNTDFWQQLRSGFRLDRKETKLVKYYEKRYTKNPKAFQKIITNAKPYIYYVLLETERNGFPSELALLPIVESSYNPFAVSPAGISTGMWQFVGMTGKRFNLAQTSQLDERQDVVKSSKAALKYLSYLNDMFGRWDLTLAAYNWGEGRIYGIIKTAKQNGDSLEYNDLPFRDATKSYVPKLVALANIIDNPSKFGITLDPMPNKPYFAIVSSGNNFDTKKVIKLANISASNFKELNPQFKVSDYSFASNQKLLLPVAKQQTYAVNAGFSSAPTIELAKTDEANSDDDANDDVIVTAIKPIDNDSIIKVNNSLKTEQVKNSSVTQNTIKPKANDKIGDLIDDIALDNTQNHKAPIVKKHKVVSYKVKRGDTLYSISKKFNTTINMIKHYNKLSGNSIQLNQLLRIK